MGRTKSCVYFSILQLLVLGVICQDRHLVDVKSDIPEDGTWEVDCDEGYADLSTDFDCGPDNGGTVLIPPEELNGEKGFWTVCAPYGCRMKYHVQPGDTLFKARVYQSDIDTEVSFDGIVWNYISGKGWVEFEESLGVAGKNEVSLRFSHFSADMFNILDKIVINGDFDPPTNPTTEASTEFQSSTETTSETTTEEDFSSSTESTTTSDDISSTTDLGTTPFPTTEDEWGSSSTVSDDPVGSSSESSTSDGPSTTTVDPTSSSTDDPTSSSTDDPTSSSTNNPTSSSTDDPTSSSTNNPTSSSNTNEPTTDTTFNPSTDNDSTTSSEMSSMSTSESTNETTENETTSVTPPPSPCTNPPCIISSMRPSTTKKPSNSSDFMSGLWGKLLFSAIGVFLFILLSACCLRFVCVRGGVFRRRSKKDDLEDIISQSGSSNANNFGKTTPSINSAEGELYLYMNRYPYLLNPSVQKANHVPNKIQISPVPPLSASSPPTSSNNPWTPRAIYRESTPYMAFDGQNSGKSIETVTVPSSTHVMNYDYVDTNPLHLRRKESQPVIPQQQNYPETQNHNRSTWVVL